MLTWSSHSFVPTCFNYSLNSLISIAITYECIRTVTTIYPRPDLIKKAADSVARFLTAANNNWKYLGECVRVTSLGECDGDVYDSGRSVW